MKQALRVKISATNFDELKIFHRWFFFFYFCVFTYRTLFLYKIYFFYDNILWTLWYTFEMYIILIIFFVLLLLLCVRITWRLLLLEPAWKKNKKQFIHRFTVNWYSLSCTSVWKHTKQCFDPPTLWYKLKQTVSDGPMIMLCVENTVVCLTR